MSKIFINNICIDTSYKCNKFYNKYKNTLNLEIESIYGFGTYLHSSDNIEFMFNNMIKKKHLDFIRFDKSILNVNHDIIIKIKDTVLNISDEIKELMLFGCDCYIRLKIDSNNKFGLYYYCNDDRIKRIDI